MTFPFRRLNKAIKPLVFASFFAVLFWLMGCSTVQKNIITTTTKEKAVSSRVEKGITEESLKCITCHEERGVTHGWIADWEGSMHARKGVGCEACHINLALEAAVREAAGLEYLSAEGSNCEDKRIHRQVIADNCGKCHIKQYNEFMKSRHSIGWKRMLECSQNLMLPKDVRTAKCAQCHNIQFKCDSCHTRHTFSTLEAKNPEACGTCHMGSDHPHYEIYISSKHGAVYTAIQSGILKESESIHALRAPVCITCHMPQGTHDISFGLAYGPVGGEPSYIDRSGNPVDEVELVKRRDAMLSVCSACHSPSFAKKTLANADAIHKDVENVVKEAKDIVFGLEKEGLFVSPISETSSIRLLGHALILGNPQLYSGKSRVERLFSKLTCSTAITWKGAYHMNPDYAHLRGWAELQMNLSDMKEEARKLQEEAELRRKMGIKLR
ncbi:MAG: hypothetical protein KGQ83_10530 [Planctomycetes bacterium]|nr:hypothetical protein [Planctomycetota bacterium]